jgi:two-component system chemotaxis response regulator CheB
MNKIRVLIVDDSAFYRMLLKRIVDGQPDMVVAGVAPDARQARGMIETCKPDVLTLDVEMPGMSGLEFLDSLMTSHPLPVVMVSTLTQRGSDAAFRALELGAVDFIAKPTAGEANRSSNYADEIAFKIRAAAHARLRAGAPALKSPAPGPAPVTAPLGNPRASTEKLIVVGASTGGTDAIRELLLHLPPDSPGVLITQHMPAGFTKSFAARLDSLCRLTVKEAEDRERVQAGHVYIAPGDRHLRVLRNGTGYLTSLDAGEPVNRHRPSVEVLFRSAAQQAGANVIGVMLTGMGKDGAAAMREMKCAGAYNFAQDEQSCVVFGMPREAIAAGAVDEVLPLTRIAPSLVKRLGGGAGT